METTTLINSSNYFRHARNEALKSDFKFRVGAVLVVGKSMIKGFNKGKTHPHVANPNKHKKASIHAELDCILKYEHYLDRRVPPVIYVYRETKDGKPGMARPCEHCMTFLKKHGVREIYYSTKDAPFWMMEEI